jgi:hypothetical protein
MKKNIAVLFMLAAIGTILVSGCGVQEEAEAVKESVSGERGRGTGLETVEVDPDAELVYLEVEDAEASSFDQTPDWAPEPDPMATVDSDMVTRWSSDYVAGPQWIYYDLGEEKVVSGAIIRWERAYASKYDIQASPDAENWQNIIEVTDATGGVMEHEFEPVRTRYIRIYGVERANEDWGISIWETELYGPASENPSDTVTMADYLEKGVDENEVKEAGRMVEELASPVVPFSEKPFQKGVVYTSWMANELSKPASDMTLAYLKKTGYDTVAVMVPAYQQELHSTEIFTNDMKGGDTPTDEALKHCVETCHKLGMRVMIKPHVDPRTDEARINIIPSEAWFDSYEKFIVRYARLAEETGAEMFSVGTELEATTFSAWAARWGQVIDAIEAVYTGDLTYSANWTEYKEVPFWDRMDYIGLDAYFPLASVKDPTPEQLVSAWNKIADEIAEWRTEKGLEDRDVILTEIGYPSADGAAIQPWAPISSVEDQQEQADCLRAVFEALSGRDWFKGFYIWQYFPQDRWSPLGFTVKGKKAEEVIKEWLQKL